jgi:integrase
MPKIENQDFSHLPSDTDIFAGFEPPQTTDGSYSGLMIKVKATEAYLQEKFDEKFHEVNTDLKRNKIKVSLKVTGNVIQLRATLPLKPNDLNQGKGTKQYLISLNIPANLDGLKTATEEAYELGKLIARQQFVWNEKYLGIKAKEKEQLKTIGELLLKFKVEYFKTRKKTIKSEHTVYQYERVVSRCFNSDMLVNEKNIIDAIDLQTSQATQWQLFKSIRVILNTCGMEIIFSRKYKNSEPRERKIPTDNEIIEAFYKYEQYQIIAIDKCKKIGGGLPNINIWRWFYAMSATFGLRPREIYTNPDFDWWLSENNQNNTWKVHKYCKTGERQALALNPDWIELFDLKNTHVIEEVKMYVATKTNFRQFTHLTNKFNYWMNKVGIEFQPYDLRHAWAIRAHLLGIPIKAAADNLGHSVQEHTKIYQRWFGLDNRIKAINEAINKKSELDFLREENERLKFKVRELESNPIS